MRLKTADDRTSDIAELRSLLEIADAREHRIVNSNLQDILSGQRGEDSVSHHLDRSYRDHPDVAVIHDLRLVRDDDVTQIDHLLVDRHRGVAVVLETKNYSGTLSCDIHGDWSVSYGDKTYGTPSPVRQASRHATTIREWFANRGHDWLREVVAAVVVPARAILIRAGIPKDAVILREDAVEEWIDQRWTVDGEAVVEPAVFNRAMIDLLSDHVPDRIDWSIRLRLSPCIQKAAEPTNAGYEAASQFMLYMAGRDSAYEEKRSASAPYFSNTGRGDRGVNVYLETGCLRARTLKGALVLHAGGSPSLDAFIARCGHGTIRRDDTGFWVIPATHVPRILGTILETDAAARSEEGGHIPRIGMIEPLAFSDERYRP
jgi:hypothetical protein